MNKNEIIESISKQLKEIVQYEVSKQKQSDKIFKDKYEILVEEIDYFLEEARDMVKNFKEQNLNISHIEAEGYLRAMITISNLVK